ncbi:AMP-binding protein [Bergeyella sp. RCAD1439]|uniref:AMP-binding protein n=1 Tax=Bergeyella anatis TaxID=3113737 RepID=UPI002E180B63|nr:AMP-binding protein [Bergeyella sp. RCAD1439]
MEVDFNQFDIKALRSSSLFEESVLFFLKDWFSPDVAVAVQTSGSTGEPKRFLVEKERMRSSARMTVDFLGLKPGDTALLALPVQYISGKMMVVRAAERRLKLWVGESSLTPLAKLDRHVDFCALTPLQVEHSLDKIHWVKNLIIGGAAVSESLKARLRARLNELAAEVRVFETYGMTETLSHIALKAIYPKDDGCFSVLEGVAVDLDDRGCLVVDAPALAEGRLHTNDLVKMEEAGRFRFLGRVDHVINSGGAKISPEVLEAVVRRYVSNEVLFVGERDEILGQRLVLVVEGERNAELCKVIEGIAFGKSFHRPKRVVFLPVFPRTPNGKVDRRAVLDLL